jgi:hypothetical protein
VVTGCHRIAARADPKLASEISMNKAALLFGCVVGATTFITGCAGLDSWLATPPATGAKGKHAPPKVSISKVTLTHAPTEAQLGIYYCEKLAKAELGELGELGCSFFGPTPARKDLQFIFDVQVEAENPSPIPVPLVQLLLAFTAFPGHGKASTGENLGAVCLSLCKDTKNCAQTADACKSTEPEVHDLKSFEGAALNFLVSVALGEKKFSDLEVQTIPPGKKIHFDTRLALDIDQMTRILGKVAEEAFQAVKHKKTPHLIIPYRVEGSAWITVESFGRIGASIPQLAGQWDLAKL